MFSTKRSEVRFDAEAKESSAVRFQATTAAATAEHEPLGAAADEARREQKCDREAEQRDEADLRGGRVELEIAVPLLEDRKPRRVVREVLAHLVRRGQDEHEDEGRRCCERDWMQPPAFQPERRAGEEQRSEVDEVPLVGVRREGDRDVRRLDRRVQPEPDDGREQDAAEGAELARHPLARRAPE